MQSYASAAGAALLVTLNGVKSDDTLSLLRKMTEAIEALRSKLAAMAVAPAKAQGSR